MACQVSQWDSSQLPITHLTVKILPEDRALQGLSVIRS